MKKFITLGILLVLCGITYMYKDIIIEKFYKFYQNNINKVELGSKNKYYRNYDFLYVQNTTDFTPSNKQDILNIFYTVLNAGKTKFSFYCPNDYKNCSKDVKAIAKNQVILSNINNYVHPYNSFKNISTETDSLGKITINIKKAYSNSDISLINTAVKEIENKTFDNSLSTRDQIKVIHDYIINNSKYDSNRTDNGVIEYKSDIAYGPLIEGYGICGGYSDAMELFLEDLNIKSYKISSEAHVWNAVNLNNNWYHLDLTWDDPVTNTGEDMISDDFFLISTKVLQDKEQTQHNFDISIYKEFES